MSHYRFFDNFKLILLFFSIRNSIGNDVNSGLVAYWNFDDADNWINPVYGGQTTSVGGGTPSRSASIKKFGSGSLYLDGSSYLSIPSPGTWLPAGSSAYSISLWFRAISFTGETILLYWGLQQVNKATSLLTTFGDNLNGGLASYWWANNLACSAIDCPLSLNTWHHVVDTYDGTTQRIYLNGVLKASRTNPSGKATERTNFCIGWLGSNEFFKRLNGYIDDLGIYNRALTLTEVQTLFSSGMMPKAINVTNGLVAYWNFENADNWMNPAYGGQATSIGSGTPSRSSSIKKFGNGSLYLDGNSWLSIPSPGLWLPAGTSSHSISLWFYRPVAFSSDYSILIHWGSYSAANKAMGLGTINSQGGVVDYRWHSDIACSSDNCPLSLNTWYHVVETYEGTTQKLYINGVLKASTITASKNPDRINFIIGYVGYNTIWHPPKWNGYIDDLCIYNRALTFTEVQVLFEPGIIPIAVNVTSGLVAYWNFDDADNWINPAYKGQTTSVGGGTPLRSASIKKFGSGSLYLDGSSYLSIPSPGTWLPAGSSAYSISLWFNRGTVYPSQFSMFIHWGLYEINKATGISSLNAQGGILGYWWQTLFECSATDCPLSINTWYHVVTTYDGTSHKIYLNGVLKSSQVISGKITERANFFIGTDNVHSKWNGYIDDLGIYERDLNLAEVQTLYNSSILPSPIPVSEQINKINADIIDMKLNMSSQISNLTGEMFSHKNELININSQISYLNDQIKTNTSGIFLEISQMKLSLKKTIATLTKLRKKDRSKKTREL